MSFSLFLSRKANKQDINEWHFVHFMSLFVYFAWVSHLSGHGNLRFIWRPINDKRWSGAGSHRTNALSNVQSTCLWPPLSRRWRSDCEDKWQWILSFLWPGWQKRWDKMTGASMVCVVLFLKIQLDWLSTFQSTSLYPPFLLLSSLIRFSITSSISSICCYHHKEVRKQSNLCGMYKRIFKESFRENVFFLFFLLLFIYPDVWSVVRN